MEAPQEQGQDGVATPEDLQKRAKEDLQRELKATKQRWGREVELSMAKGTPGAPFPVACTRYTPQPEAAMMWDIDELPVRLVVHSPDTASMQVSVEVPPYFPGELPRKIEEALVKEWKRQLRRSNKATTWMVEAILEHAENRFGDLLRLVPEYVDCYPGVDSLGASMRRYTLVGPAAEEEEEEEEVDEEEEERRAAEFIAREQARIEAELASKSEQDQEKRKLAEQGLLEDGPKARQLSKKELADLNKSRKERSGQRWRKTGPKAHKPVKD